MSFGVKGVDGAEDSKILPLEVTEGQFKGCRFTLTNFAFPDAPPDENGHVLMTYDFDVINDFVINEDNREAFEELLNGFVYNLVIDYVKGSGNAENE